MDPDRGVERWAGEPGKPGEEPRSPFQRDRARVLHSAALRRLAAKTQVVGIGEDFPRTRLTHSLECAQIGREMAGALGADPEVVDAACLAHDLGHPPFGHNGELVLAELAGPAGGFEGNAQSLRILTRLEAKVPGAGLNLTRATLDATMKYPWPRREGTAKFGVYPDDRPVFDWVRVGAPAGRRCLEAQVMDWADDVAYSVHDLEDGVFAGTVPLDGLDRPELAEIAVRDYGCTDPDGALARLRAEPWWPAGYDGSLAGQIALKRLTSALTGRFCSAAVRATRAAAPPGPLQRYRADLVVPAAVRAECALLKAVAAVFVMSRRVAEQERERTVLGELFGVVLAGAPGGLQPAFRPAWAAAPDEAGRLRVVVDQIAALTDTSALAWHARVAG